jgi:glycosyltransferase involved in cell wall biosynthesis
MLNRKLSILTPIFNGTSYVEDLIISIQEQDYKNVEHIIFNDGSTDEHELIKIIDKYPNIVYYSRENKGQYATLNELINLASGDFILIISSDDKLYDKKAISNIFNFLSINQELDIVYGKTYHINSIGAPLSDQFRFLNGPFPKWIIKNYSLIYHCSLVINKKCIIERQIFFDPKYKYFGDWDWIIRLSDFEIGYSNNFVSSIRWHENQTFKQGSNESKKNEITTIIKKYHLNYILHISILIFIKIRSIILNGISMYKKF